MTVTLPTGESFSGKYVHITSTSTVDVMPPVFWDRSWAMWGPFGSPWYDGTDFPTFTRNYSGKVVATLFGDRGDTMRCRFRLSVPERACPGVASATAKSPMEGSSPPSFNTTLWA
jgi:hypothetical protein